MSVFTYVTMWYILLCPLRTLIENNNFTSIFPNVRVRRTEILSFRILSKNLPEIGPVRGGFLLNILKFDRVPEHVTVRPALNRKY